MKPASEPALGTIDRGPADAATVAVADGGGPATDRRASPRTKTMKGAKIVLGPSDLVACTVLDISDTGAVLEVQTPIEQKTIDVVFDGDEWPRRSCRVVWVKASRMGVEFVTMGALLDGYEAARQRHNAELAERQRKEKAIDRELQEVIGLMTQAAKFLEEKAITYGIVNRTLRIAHQRAPVVTVRYDPEVQKYDTTFMPDGSHTIANDSRECVKAIGEMLFGILTRK